MKMLLHISTKDAVAFYKGEATKAYSEIYKPYDHMTVSIDEYDELHPNVNDGCFIIKRGPKTIETFLAEKDVVSDELGFDPFDPKLDKLIKPEVSE